MTKFFGLSLALAVAVALGPTARAATERSSSDGAITVLVMDPLALPALLSLRRRLRPAQVRSAGRVPLQTAWPPRRR